MIRDDNIPFAMINGPMDPFINHEYCAKPEFGTAFSPQPVLIAGAGHAPFLEDPIAFNAAFLDFVQASCRTKLPSDGV